MQQTPMLASLLWPAGKMRNRRYVLRKGPLVVYGNDNGIAKAFRNLPGVEVASVDRLNLLQVGELVVAVQQNHKWLPPLLL